MAAKRWDPDVHGVHFASTTAASERQRSSDGHGRQRAPSAQQTLSPWTKGSGWRPGMPVKIATTSSTTTSVRSSSKVLQPKVRAVSKVDAQSSIQTYMSNGKQAAPIEIEDSFEASSANATLGESVDTSVEFVSHHDPQTAMLKYAALLHSNALEAARMQSPRSPQLSAPTLVSASRSRPQIMHPPLGQQQASPMQSSRRAPFSTYRDADPVAVDVAFDWDDPAVSAGQTVAQVEDLDEDSDSSLPSFGPSSKPLQPVAPSLTSNRAPPTLFIKSLDKDKAERSQAEVRRLTLAAKAATAEAKAAREEAKATQVAEWKRRFRTFSYDNGSWVIPKIWYFRGPDSAFKSCDVRPGHAEPEAQTLEEVVASLRGPLGFDLEWNKLDWNDTFTRKVSPGPTGLFQIGDHDNIILYQMGQPRALPACLRAVIEDGNVPKLGVGIKNDGRKLHTDFKIVPRGLLELSDLAKLVEPRLQQYSRLISMQQLVADFLERYLDKGDVRTSNWSKILNDMQRRYAANDVFAALQLYKRMCGYAEVGQFTIDFETLLHDLHVTAKGESKYKTQHGKNAPAVRATTSATTATSATSGTRFGRPVRRASIGATPRQAEAWTLWHTEGLDREAVAARMGIKEATISSYVLKALHKDPEYAFDPDRLRTLMKDTIMRQDDQAAFATVLARVQQ